LFECSWQHVRGARKRNIDCSNNEVRYQATLGKSLVMMYHE